MAGAVSAWFSGKKVMHAASYAAGSFSYLLYELEFHLDYRN